MTDLLIASIDEGDSWIMIDGLGMHGFQDRKFINHLGCVWQQITDPATTFPMPLKRLDRRVGEELY